MAEHETAAHASHTAGATRAMPGRTCESQTDADAPGRQSECCSAASKPRPAYGQACAFVEDKRIVPSRGGPSTGGHYGRHAKDKATRAKFAGRKTRAARRRPRWKREESEEKTQAGRGKEPWLGKSRLGNENLRFAQEARSGARRRQGAVGALGEQAEETLFDRVRQRSSDGRDGFRA